MVQVDTEDLWECARIEAKDGYEVIGPDGDATFKATTSIELGAGFSVGEQAKFRAVVAP